MAFIKKRKIKGVVYFALIEKVKREDGSWGSKQLKSFGRVLPPEYIKAGSIEDIETKAPKLNATNGRLTFSNLRH